MVELTPLENLIRTILLYWVFPVGIILLTPLRLIVDFFTMSNPDYFQPWKWSTDEECDAARQKHTKKILDIQEQVKIKNSNIFL